MTSMSGNTLSMSPQQAELGDFNDEYTPDLDYLDGDASFDFENADLGGDMIGALPGSGSDANDEQFNDSEQHEKRKNPDGTDASEEGDAKRQEMQEGEKGAKKPGRKPLTSEPTTKRKAQNRAAQRAFRERKEKHLKDLETKVSELTKSQEADKHENGLLKAQVDRLQIELRDYRKRLSLNSGADRSSPPLTAHAGPNRSNSGSGYGSQNTFQFDFPKFGALPGSQIFGHQPYGGSVNDGVLKRDSITPPVTRSPTTNSSSNAATHQAQIRREDSSARSMSPKSWAGNGTGSGSGSHTSSPSQLANTHPSFTAAPYSTNDNMHGFASTLPQMTIDPFSDLFSPDVIKSASMERNSYFNSAQATANALSNVTSSNGGDTTAGLNRVFHFNSSSSNSDSASPSASSSSQWNANGANSSCGTSPEPAHDSPANKTLDKQNVDISSSDRVNSLRQYTNNQMTQLANDFTGNPTIGLTDSYPVSNFTVPATTSFHPPLFGDYRDSQDAIVGSGDFTAGFFDDALNPAPYDLSSPSNLFGILQSPQQTNATLQAPRSAAANAPTPSAMFLAEIDKTRDGGDDDYGLPGTAQSQDDPKHEAMVQFGKKGSGKLISCSNIWNQLQSNPDFQDGKFDLDSLCSELRSKARCSESGVMVNQDHVDAALRKLGKKDEITGVFQPAKEAMSKDMPQLMFEQDSWDKLLKRLGDSTGQVGR